MQLRSNHEKTRSLSAWISLFSSNVSDCIWMMICVRWGNIDSESKKNSKYLLSHNCYQAKTVIKLLLTVLSFTKGKSSSQCVDFFLKNLPIWSEHVHFFYNWKFSSRHIENSFDKVAKNDSFNVGKSFAQSKKFNKTMKVPQKQF